MQNNDSENSHISPPPATTAHQPIVEANPTSAPPPPPSLAERLVPRNVRDRKFRAHSFAAQLNSVQRDTLFAWMKTLSTRQIVEKVAAPPPQGFGLKVCPTTIDRLRVLVKNMAPLTIASEALDTAADLLENHQSAHIAALHEALHLMLYSNALKSAARGDEPKLIDHTLAALTRLEKLRRLRSANDPSHLAQHASPPATRHHVHLTISPVPARSEQSEIAGLHHFHPKSLAAAP